MLDGILYTKLRSGDVCHAADNIKEFKLGKITPGKWHTIVIGASWRHNGHGWFKTWFDNKLKVDEYEVDTIHDTDNRLYEFRVGFYPK